MVARSVAGFDGIYVDANAVSPSTAREIGGRFVDGGIVAPPPRDPGTTRLYLSGKEAERVASLFQRTALEPRVISDEPGAASALKMVYAAWTKGTAALLMAIRALAGGENVEELLLDEWRLSLPELIERSGSAARSADREGRRLGAGVGEAAATFAAAGLPDGFHQAAADVFRRVEAGVR